MKIRKSQLIFALRILISTLFLFSALVTLFQTTLDSSLFWLNWRDFIDFYNSLPFSHEKWYTEISQNFLGLFIWTDFLLMLIFISPPKNINYFLIQFISSLFILSAFAKLYPIPMYGITKVFEEGQLIPMGFSENIAPYFSRLIIGAELFLAITILFNNYLKKLILPLSILMISIFSIHLISQLFGTSENCGCFGDLIPMTPLQALIKNILTLIILSVLYMKSEDIRGKFSNLIILFLIISTIMFAFLPISSQSKSVGSSFITYVENEEFVNLEEGKILCFFDAGCEHCQHAARSLDSLSNLSENFPLVHIIFSDTEEDKIPGFFEVAGKEYNYQIMPFANYDTDEIDSYMEITFPDYDNPVVILYDGNRQIRLYDGTEKNEFKAEDLVRILENE